MKAQTTMPEPEVATQEDVARGNDTTEAAPLKNETEAIEQYQEPTDDTPTVAESITLQDAYNSAPQILKNHIAILEAERNRLNKIIDKMIN